MQVENVRTVQFLIITVSRDTFEEYVRIRDVIDNTPKYIRDVKNLIVEIIGECEFKIENIRENEEEKIEIFIEKTVGDEHGKK